MEELGRLIGTPSDQKPGASDRDRAMRPNLTANLEPSAETNAQQCVSVLGTVLLGVLTVDVEPSAWGIEYSGIYIKCR